MKNTLKRALLIVFFDVLITLAPMSAQPYSPTERLQIARNARRLIQDKYLTNMEILTHYEVNQPFEALQSHIDGLLRDAFRTRDALVFNEFRPTATAQTTLPEYVKDCRIFSAGKPVINLLNFEEARYDLQETRDGLPYISVYLDKQLQGTDKKGKPFRFQHLTEFRVAFAYDKRLTAYHTFKLVGINKVSAWPATAFALTASAAPAENAPIDLSTVMAGLVNRLKAFLPDTTRQLALDTFTYNRCGATTSLSDRIFATLSSSLQKQTSLRILPVAQWDEKMLLVRGYYRDTSPVLQVILELYDPLTNQLRTTVSSSELPLSWLTQQQLKLKPDTYQQLMAVRDTFQQQPISLPANLTISLRTNRGRDHVEYWEGNQMTLDVKASRPCHLRLVYLQANGDKLLLENDFEIKPGQENQYIRIAPGESFICSEPFGTEHLLAFAAESPFCPIPSLPNQTLYVRNEAGSLLLIGSLAHMFEAVTCQKGQKAVAQDRIQITTRGLATSSR
ncbi:hypothetical protein [Spirosoma gilvum]